MCNCVNSCYVPLRFRLTKFRALSIPLTLKQCPTNRIICLLGLWIFHHCLHKNIWVNSSDIELRHLNLISFRFFLGFCKSRKNDCWNGKQCCEYLFLLKNHSKVQWILCSSLMWLKVLQNSVAIPIWLLCSRPEQSLKSQGFAYQTEVVLSM